MVNPVKYLLNTAGDRKLVTIEPVFEEIAGGDLFPTGRYIVVSPDGVLGEIHIDGDLFDWAGDNDPGIENIFKIAQFIREYEEPQLAEFIE